MYKALYNFAGQNGEMNLTKGELVEVKEKDDNGGWPTLTWKTYGANKV